MQVAIFVFKLDEESMVLKYLSKTLCKQSLIQFIQTTTKVQEALNSICENENQSKQTKIEANQY